MGRRGPRPQSEMAKKLRGTSGAAPEVSRRSFPVGVPDMPPGLGTVGKRYWRETIELLAPVPGLLSPVDRHALEAYCRLWEEYHMANNIIRAEGLHVPTHGGVRGVHPLHAVKNKAMAQIKHFVARFGLSPGDRENLKITGPPAENNPFEQYLAKQLDN